MQWDGSSHAGFTTGRPWLPVSADHRQRNVATEAGDPESLWSLYRQLLDLRRRSPALSHGACRVIPGTPRECLVYERLATMEESAMERMLVAVNFSQRTATFSLLNDSTKGSVLLSTTPRLSDALWDPRRIQLGPNEGVLVRLSNGST
jgi:glycosidase